MDKIKVLQKLGLTEYESRAYLSLANLGPSTVKEIVLDSKLPRNKAYEALQRLENRGKVISLPLSPRKYKITNPEALKEEADYISDSVKQLIKTIEQPKLKEFQDFFWVIKSQEAIRNKMAAQNEKSEKEILFCSTLSKPFYKNLRILDKAVKRKVNVKIICTFDEKLVDSYREYVKTGAEIRVFNKNKFGPLMPRISIFDRKIARLTVGSPEVKNAEDYITLWTESQAFALMLRNHFINMWKSCKPIKEYMKASISS